MTKIKYSVELQNLLDSIATLKALKGQEVDPPSWATNVEELSSERVTRAKLTFQEQIHSLIQFADVIKRDKYMNLYYNQFMDVIAALLESNEVIVFENSQLHFRNQSYRRTLNDGN